MRRWAAATFGVAAVAALAGCGNPAGVDGDLLNDWPAFAQAKTPVPQVGKCYAEEYEAVWHGPFDPMDCGQSHAVETAYVGTFTGSTADASNPPSGTGSDAKKAFTTCTKEANDYLGGDWHGGYIWLGLVLPSAAAWDGGARWFRCDLAKTKDVEYNTTDSTGSLKDGLSGSKPAAVTCINTTEDKKGVVQSERPADCDSPHNGELAGVYEADDASYPGDSALSDQASDACERVVAKYLGLSGSKVTNPVVGWLYFWPSEDRWELGDRGFKCFAYAFTKSKKMTGSVKGIRNGTPKG